MGSINVYIKPFTVDGFYADDYINITADVDRSSVSNISKQIDNSDYDVGVFSYSNFALKLNNQSGIYNDIDSITSIFKFRRSGSLIKISWLFGETEPICGIAICGEAILGPEQTIFEGLLSDIASFQDIKDQKITFDVLGKESIFGEVEAPYSLLSASDNISVNIYNLLNQPKITDIMTVIQGNITPDYDFQYNDKSDFENKTVKEVLDDLLVVTNSILKIENDIVYVVPRAPSATLKQTFYGQASPNGVEDIANIRDIKKGVNRTFNLWRWQSTSLAARAASSITNNGVRKKEIGYPFITNSTIQQNILDTLRDEFGDPKREFSITVLVTTATLQLNLLDKINIDYPTNVLPVGDNIIPIVGVSKVGEFYVPYSEFSLTLSPTEYFKIIGITINLLQETIELKLREI
jgi:hypothetical protein